MNTCERHDNCVIVYTTPWQRGCPICEMEEERDKLKQERDDLEIENGQLESEKKEYEETTR